MGSVGTHTAHAPEQIQRPHAKISKRKMILMAMVCRQKMDTQYRCMG